MELDGPDLALAADADTEPTPQPVRSAVDGDQAVWLVHLIDGDSVAVAAEACVMPRTTVDPLMLHSGGVVVAVFNGNVWRYVVEGRAKMLGDAAEAREG